MSLALAVSSDEKSSALPERSRIVLAARALYFEHGITAVPLATIARRLSLSESAVRYWFPTEVPLVQDVVHAYSIAVQEELHACKQHSRTAVAELWAYSNWAIAARHRVPYLFLRQLAADYPTCWQRWQELIAYFLPTRLRDNLCWGIREGLYRNNLQPDELAQTWTWLLSGLGAAFLDNPKPEAVHGTLLEHFLWAVFTPAGLLAWQSLLVELPLAAGATPAQPQPPVN